MIVNDKSKAKLSSPNKSGTHLNISPPKYTIKTWITEINSIITLNVRLFDMLDKIQSLEHLERKQFIIPLKINST